MNLNIKSQFPIFENHKELVYLDSAATTQKPQVVIDSIVNFYSQNNANIHRGAYTLSDNATQEYEQARKEIANFIGAGDNEIFFTSGATLGLNVVAKMLCKNLKKGDNVVLTDVEHHSNLVPWQELALEKGFELRFLTLKNNFNDLEKIDNNTKVVSFTHISNVLGMELPIENIIKIAKKFGSFVVIDACQSVAHKKIDVKNLDCDFLVFSGHKMYGPTGIGVVYTKEKLQKSLDPVIFGGGMVTEVNLKKSSWTVAPTKFEAGTPNIAGVIGLAEASKIISSIGFEKIKNHEKKLFDYFISKVKNIDQINIIGDSDTARSVISLEVKGIHPHDVASIANSFNVAFRAGQHCAAPLIKQLGLSGTVRISFGIYNTKEDLDTCVVALKKAIEIFS